MRDKKAIAFEAAVIALAVLGADAVIRNVAGLSAYQLFFVWLGIYALLALWEIALVAAKAREADAGGRGRNEADT